MDPWKRWSVLAIIIGYLIGSCAMQDITSARALNWTGPLQRNGKITCLSEPKGQGFNDLTINKYNQSGIFERVLIHDGIDGILENSLAGRATFDYSQAEGRMIVTIINTIDSDDARYECVITSGLPTQTAEMWFHTYTTHDCRNDITLTTPDRKGKDKDTELTFKAEAPCAKPAISLKWTVQNPNKESSGNETRCGTIDGYFTNIASLTFPVKQDTTVNFTASHPGCNAPFTTQFDVTISPPGPGCVWWCILIIIVVILICVCITVWICMCIWCPTICCQFCREKELNKPLCDCCKPPGWVGTRPGDCNHKDLK